MGNRVDLAVSRILNQFTASPRWIELLTTIVTRLEEVDDLLASLATLRWIDTAEGVWLDDVGEIVGIPRFFGENEGPFFTYKSAYPGTDDPDLAYSGPLPAAPTGGRYQSVFGLDNDIPLSDDDYRRWIKAKAKTTGTAGTLRDIWVFINESLELTDHVVEVGGTRLVLITTTAPLTPWKQGKIRQWAPINAGIDFAFTT
jgi:hypothetical protein